MAQRHFVVREEGGYYEFMSKRRWQRERPNVPIWGYVKDGRVHCYDKIILRIGLSPWRTHKRRVS